MTLIRCLIICQDKSMDKSNLLAFSAAFIYFILCCLIKLVGFEGSWGGFLIFLLAIPFSFLSIIISKYIGGETSFILLNSFWWYFLVKILYLFKKT